MTKWEYYFDHGGVVEAESEREAKKEAMKLIRKDWDIISVWKAKKK